MSGGKEYTFTLFYFKLWSPIFKTDKCRWPRFLTYSAWWKSVPYPNNWDPICLGWKYIQLKILTTYWVPMIRSEITNFALRWQHHSHTLPFYIVSKKVKKKKKKEKKKRGETESHHHIGGLANQTLFRLFVDNCTTQYARRYLSNGMIQIQQNIYIARSYIHWLLVCHKMK